MYTSTRLDELLGRVSKPGRYSGGEYNACLKNPASVALRAALIFPDVYEVGMSSLGFQVIYHFLNKREDTYCERCFTPWPDMEEALRKEGLPLFTLETATPISQMDFVGFSLGSETTYTNVLSCLDLGDIPVFSSERTDAHPIVIAGGHCAFSPEPMADFVDCFVIGEGEEVVSEICDILIKHKNLPRTEKLRWLSGIEGIYIPQFLTWQYDTEGKLTGYTVKPGVTHTVRKRIVKDFENLEYPDRPVIPNVEAVHDRISIEVMRGCTQGCRFCQAGVITRPVRERSPQKITDIAERLIPATGYDDISLVSLSTADYSGVLCTVRKLTNHFGNTGIGISLPSIRVDSFSVNLTAEIQKVRKTGLTLAPEAGTERLRRVINKTISDEEIFAAAEAAWRQGWKKIKLYFMIGLPTETDDDVLGIAELVKEIQRRAWRDARVKLHISIGASSFVPKPHTPFQWRAQASVEELRHKINLLKHSTRLPGVKLSWDEPSESLLEGLLARGDRRVGQVIYKAWKNGARFDAWSDQYNEQAWLKAFQETGITPESVTNRVRLYDEVLPWDHIETGVSKKYLRLEDMRSVIEFETPDCRDGRCFGCGIFKLIPEHARYGTCYHD